MTKADRDRLFTAVSKKSPLLAKPAPVVPAETAKRGRGVGKVPASESFTLVIPLIYWQGIVTWPSLNSVQWPSLSALRCKRIWLLLPALNDLQLLLAGFL